MTQTTHRNQFSLLSLMWITTAMAWLFSYARVLIGNFLVPVLAGVRR